MLTLRQMVCPVLPGKAPVRKVTVHGEMSGTKTVPQFCPSPAFPTCLSYSFFPQINVGQLNWHIRLVFPAGTFDNWAFVSEDLCCGSTITSVEILFSSLVITLPLIDIALPIKEPH